MLPDRHHGLRDHGDGWQSQLHPHHQKWHKKQVTTPQERCPTGFVLPPLLSNTYISDLPTTVSRKYADDLTTMHADGDW